MQVEVDGSRVVVALGGELDDATAERLGEIDIAAHAGSGADTIAMRLEGLEFVDSSGIGALVRMRNRADALGLRFEMDAVPMLIERTLAMAGVAALFGLDPHA